MFVCLFWEGMEEPKSKLTDLLQFGSGISEETAADEKRQLLENLAEKLASSRARKQYVVQVAVSNLLESAADRTSNLDVTDCEITSSVRKQWTTYIEETESHYLEDRAAADVGRQNLEEDLQQYMEMARTGSKQWKTDQASLLDLGEGNVASVDSILKTGTETNQLICARLTSVASTSVNDFEVVNKDLLSSIECLLKLDLEACDSIDSMVAPCNKELRGLKSGHYHKIVEINENANKHLEVAEPSYSTPRRRKINLPSTASIEELKTPGFEDLVKSFWESNSAASKQHAIGETKQFSGAIESQAQDFGETLEFLLLPLIKGSWGAFFGFFFDRLVDLNQMD